MGDQISVDLAGREQYVGLLRRAHRALLRRLILERSLPGGKFVDRGAMLLGVRAGSRFRIASLANVGALDEAAGVRPLHFVVHSLPRLVQSLLAVQSGHRSLLLRIALLLLALTLRDAGHGADVVEAILSLSLALGRVLRLDDHLLAGRHHARSSIVIAD